MSQASLFSPLLWQSLSRSEERPVGRRQFLLGSAALISLPLVPQEILARQVTNRLTDVVYDPAVDAMARVYEAQLRAVRAMVRAMLDDYARGLAQIAARSVIADMEAMLR